MARARGARAFAGALLAFAVTVPLACHALPLGALLVESVIVDGRVTLAVHRDVLAAPRTWTVFIASVHVAAWGAALSTVLGTACACALARVPGARGPLEPWIALPLALPPYLLALAWLHACGPRGVPSVFGAPPLALDGPWSAGAILGLWLVGIPLLVARAALDQVDSTGADAARLALGRRAAFLAVTWPALRPAIGTAFLVCFVLMLATYDVPAMLQVETQGSAILAAFQHTADARRATALAGPGLALATVLVLALVRRRPRAASRSAELAADAPPPALGAALRATALPALVAVLAGVLPVAILIVQTGAPAAIDSMLRTAGGNLRLGLEVALVAAAIATVAAFLLAELSLHARSAVLRRAVDVLVLAALAWPPTLLGIGLVRGYAASPDVLHVVWETPWILVVAALGRFLPFAFLVVRAALARLGPRPLESARVAGLSPLAIWVQIHARAIAGSLVAAAFLVFALTLTELPAAQLLAPPGRTTLPIRLFTILHYGQDRLVAAMGLALVVFAGTSFLIARLMVVPRGGSR